MSTLRNLVSIGHKTIGGSAVVASLIGLLVLIACSSDSIGSGDGVQGSTSGSGTSGTGTSGTGTSGTGAQGSPPDCPGIKGRFGGPQPEGAMLCEETGGGVLTCKGGQWVSAGVSCADSTTKDIAGVVHACECHTDYGLWSAHCYYAESTCLDVYAGGGKPCEGVAAGTACGQSNWLYLCDGKNGVTASAYCVYGCGNGKCQPNEPCVNAAGGSGRGNGTWCGSRLTGATDSVLFQSVTADANTLYECHGYGTSKTTPCANGCQQTATPDSNSDSCK